MRVSILSLFLLATQVLATPRAIYLVHTNDIHSWFAPRQARYGEGRLELGGAPVLDGLLVEMRTQHEDAVLYLDAGDFFQGTPISTLTRGEGCIEVMRRLAPDAICVGNHEFDYGFTRLDSLAKASGLPLLAANLQRDDGGFPFQREMHMQREGVEILVLGLVPDDLHGLCSDAATHGVHVMNSFEVAAQWLEETDGQADLRIALSHRGWFADSLLAATTPGFDLIIGGHSHTVIHPPAQVAQTWIVQTGAQLYHVGVDTLIVEPGIGLVEFRGGLLPLETSLAEPNAEMAAFVSRQEMRVEELLGEQIGTLHSDWVRVFAGESNIGNWLTAQVRNQLNTDLALWNSGGIRKDLMAGPITLRDAWEIAPFGNEMLLVELSGSELLETYQAILRGEFEFLQFDGMRARFNDDHALVGFDLPEGAMKEDQLYRVAISDYVWSKVSAFPWLQAREHSVIHSGRIDRDIVIQALRQNPEAVSSIDGRWNP